MHAPYHTLSCHTMPYRTVPYHSYHTIPCLSIRYHTIRYGTIPSYPTTPHYTTLHHTSAPTPHHTKPLDAPRMQPQRRLHLIASLYAPCNTKPQTQHRNHIAHAKPYHVPHQTVPYHAPHRTTYLQCRARFVPTSRSTFDCKGGQGRGAKPYDGLSVRLTNQSTNQQINQQINQPVNQPNKQVLRMQSSNQAIK